MRISKTQWLIIAVMGANMLYSLAYLIFSPIPALAPFYIVSFLKSVFLSILVSLGIGWARILFVIFTSVSIFMVLLDLAVYFSSDTNQGTTPLTLRLIHLAMLVWTMQVLAFSENVSGFFHRRKHRIPN